MQHHCLGSSRFPADSDMGCMGRARFEDQDLTPGRLQSPRSLLKGHWSIQEKSTLHMRSADDGGPQTLDGASKSSDWEQRCCAALRCARLLLMGTR